MRVRSERKRERLSKNPQRTDYVCLTNQVSLVAVVSCNGFVCPHGHRFQELSLQYYRILLYLSVRFCIEKLQGQTELILSLMMSKGTHSRIRMVQKVLHRVAGLRERLFEYPCHCGNGTVVVSTVGDDLPKR